MLTNYVIPKWCHLIGTCLQWGLKNYAKSNVPRPAVLLRDQILSPKVSDKKKNKNICVFNCMFSLILQHKQAYI